MRKQVLDLVTKFGLISDVWVRMELAMEDGWKFIESEDGNNFFWEKGGITLHVLSGWFYRDYREAPIVPDYKNDLNAMHRLEKTLGHLEWQTYVITLRDLMLDSKEEMEETVLGDDMPLWMSFGLWHTSAALRAEAFCIVRGIFRNEHT